MDEVAALRRFNRAYTQRIGVLDESYLGSGRPLGPSRVLFEIGARGMNVGELRRRLGLDSGYLSRLLRQLEREQLVEVHPAAHDRRQRRAVLTAAGRREWRRLDRRSERLAVDLLAPLSARQRGELAGALATAQRLLQAATVTFEEFDPTAPIAVEAVATYVAELQRRFPAGFDPDAGGPSDHDAMRRPAGAFVVVVSDQCAVACGGVQGIDDDTGEIKRMWVDAEWRGLGLGGRLLRHLEGIATQLGRRRVVLDTNGTLVEAIAMYERAGYRSIERYNDNPYAEHWFEKRLDPPVHPAAR